MIKVRVENTIREQGQLVVEATLLEQEGNKERVIDTRRFGYALDTPSKTIKAELAKWIETYKHDSEVGKQAAEMEAKGKVANETMESLSDFEVSEKTGGKHE